MDTEKTLQRFLDLAEIPGRSGEEWAVATRLIEMLKEAGLSDSQIRFDGAEARTHLAGNCGNLLVTLPGKGQGPVTMLSAHMDTVPICVGSQPVVDGDQVRSSAKTGLGADDRSGCAAILTAAIERIQRGDPNFPPAVIAFFIQEEIGLHGARNLDVSLIGHVDRAFNFDGGAPDKVRIGAIGGERMSIRIFGTPAHAGVAPEQGASAIVMAAKAIADLDARGWLGNVQQDSGVGTANVGIINGGDATNVITPEVTLRAEARSHDAAMRTRIVKEIQTAFTLAAQSVTTDTGLAGRIEFESQVDYEAFRLPDDHPSIQAAGDAIKQVGREPVCDIANGGLDANWLFRHGIESVTLGCGQQNIHTVDERLSIPEYLDACRIATWLITEGASGER
ncbi:M20/M25/M40 family metallo-hydrolase [Novipirellula artificiosorum]|uniref:Carboxypeptidase G2 n=1 Tax=Novipirellula artificiosorum TaxID=2528016 RepID=A0A5C6DX36_9BACT|nr:M20/M25/M40 family metallo-hydrolase [Novipirellula artificiosorum]TWU40774.1 Carboxypeptidase G2 precursor [Novipirellula artificiosorum]